MPNYRYEVTPGDPTLPPPRGYLWRVLRIADGQVMGSGWERRKREAETLADVLCSRLERKAAK